MVGFAMPDTGLRLIDNSVAGAAIAQENNMFFLAGGTATGTTQATALVLSSQWTIAEFTTVTSTAAGCQLPISFPGDRVYICNNGTSTLTVYTNVNETVASPKINATAGTTGVTQASGNNAMYVCMTSGQWYRISGT